MSVKPYLSWLFGCIDNPDLVCPDGSVPTRTQAQSGNPDTLLTPNQTPLRISTTEEFETLTWLYHSLTVSAGHMEYWEMGRSWGPLHMTLPMVVHCASCSSIWAVTAWHRIVGVLKNRAEPRWRIELGPCWVATLEVGWVQTEVVADSGWIWISEWGIPVGWTHYDHEILLFQDSAAKLAVN